MANAVGEERASHRRGPSPATTNAPAAGRERGRLVGTGTRGPAHEKRASRALDQTGRAARLLERAFVCMIGQEELSMPALERLYAALQETEATVAAIETRFPRETAR